jgi:hypothetical protein
MAVVVFRASFSFINQVKGHNSSVIPINKKILPAPLPTEAVQRDLLLDMNRNLLKNLI